MLKKLKRQFKPASERKDAVEEPSRPNTPSDPPTTSAMSFLEGAKDFVIRDSILTNVHGNMTIMKFDGNAPLSAEFEPLFTKHVAGYITVKDLDDVKKHVLSQAIRDLPRVAAAYNDYTPKDSRRRSCFEGTRQGLRQEIATWIMESHRAEIYVLSGLAGIGKSTVVQTVAETANNLRSLGASFFFSRDENDRRNAKMFFTTIAYQLCIYDEDFSQAIGSVLLTDQGSDATSKEPHGQLKALIIKPLRDIVKLRTRPIVMVIDALDECDEEDALIVLTALNRLVQELPSFKIILTTRPQPHLQRIFDGPDAHKIFHLQNIEDMVIDDDIRRYLEHGLSRDQVMARLPTLRIEWNANEEDIEHLVRAAGRLFIIASTMVRFILDTTVYNPRSQMEALKNDDRASLDKMEAIYSVVLRYAVPPKCKAHIVERFKVVIGTILAIQEPLAIRTLEAFAPPRNADDITAVLTNLQSVIILDSETPRIYHKSFFDFLTDADSCTEGLLINLRVHHTRVAIRCFQIMNNCLKKNILDLDDAAHFLKNDESLSVQGISEDQLCKKIPAELRYACIYWANHIEGADADDADLMKEMEEFAMRHLVHWLEALSLVGKLEQAHRALRVVLNVMKSLSPDTKDITIDGLRFVAQFYDIIQRSAHHIYHSALPFTPKNRLLYKTNGKEKTHTVSQLGGGLVQWDSLVADLSFSRNLGKTSRKLAFSQNGSQLALLASPRKMRFQDAMTGTPIRICEFSGDHGKLATNDFSVIALPQDNIVTVYSIASSMLIATFTQSARILELALSPDGSRLAVALTDHTIILWDVGKKIPMATLCGPSVGVKQLTFSPTNYALASLSNDGDILLWNGANGEFMASLDVESQKHNEFVFSHDGSRLVSSTHEGSVTLWNGENGRRVGVVSGVGSIDILAISDDGSFLAAGQPGTVKLWSGVVESPLPLVDTLEVSRRVDYLAFSPDLLAISSWDDRAVILYDFKSHSVLSTFDPDRWSSLALSPDGSRLASLFDYFGTVKLWDVEAIKATNPASEKLKRSSCVTALTFSSDCSQLASGFYDGAVELWDTNHTGQATAVLTAHSKKVTGLAFTPDCAQLASRSNDGTVRLWDGRDGSPSGSLEHSFHDSITSMAISTDLLAVGTLKNIALWNYRTIQLVGTLDQGSISLSFSSGGLLASAYNGDHPFTPNVTVWDIENRTASATFKFDSSIRELMLSPDGSQFYAELASDDFKFFDIATKKEIRYTGNEAYGWAPHLDGTLISCQWDRDHGHYLARKLPDSDSRAARLWFPREVDVQAFTVGSTACAVGFHDGRIFLVRSSMTHFN